MPKLRHIHINKLAVEGKIYTEDGRYYIGQSDGTLKVEQYLNGDLSGTTLRSIVSQIGDYTTDELITLLESLRDDISDIEDDITELENYDLSLNTVNVIDASTDMNTKLSMIVELLIEQNKLLKQLF